MLALGLSSKREITRIAVRVRTAMAAQTMEQGRYQVDAAHGRTILANPRYTGPDGRYGTGSRPRRSWSTRRTPGWAPAG